MNGDAEERMHAEGEILRKRGRLVTDLQRMLRGEGEKVINKW